MSFADRLKRVAALPNLGGHTPPPNRSKFLPASSSRQSGTREVGDLLKATIAAHRCGRHLEQEDLAAARMEFRLLREALAVLRDLPSPDVATGRRIRDLHSEARELATVLGEKEDELEARSRPTWRPPASVRR